MSIPAIGVRTATGGALPSVRPIIAYNADALEQSFTFEPMRTDPTVFQAVMIDGGTLTWPNGADINPDVLYYGGTPPWAQGVSHTEAVRS